MSTLAWLVAGLLFLSLGAELLVRGAAALAAALGVSALVVGLTVVAFGTSTPELVVSVQSALRGQADIALGNVVGSNIFNVLFILGLSAVIVPLTVAQRLVRIDVPLLIGLSLLVGLLALDGRLGRIDGLLLVAGLVAYTAWAIVQSRREQAAIRAEYAAGYPGARSASIVATLPNLALIVVGLLGLMLGARLFTDAAVAIARIFGMSDLVIGLTLVAAGTSLPELATSAMAALRGERDIAVGNVVGSNLFNLLGVLGMASLVSTVGVEVPKAALTLDLPVMVAVAVACLPIFFTGHAIARWEGALFLLYGVAYMGFLVLAETQANVTRTFGSVMLLFVVPLTIVTLGVAVARSWRGNAR